MVVSRLAIATAIGASLVLLPRVGSPHVAPSVRENNRYLKLTPAGDRIRFVYTVYMGEVPGRAARQRIDADRNGTIEASEAHRYGRALGQEVAGAIDLRVDDSPYPLSWTEVHVGLGTPSIDAGSFAVDLVTWICLDTTRAPRRHRIVLFDRFEVPQPGESELRVETAPGVDIVRSTLGEDGRHSQLEFKWLGGTGPTSTLGYVLELDIDPARAPMSGDGACGTAAPADEARAARRKRTIAATVAAAAIALLLLASVARRTRRRTGR